MWKISEADILRKLFTRINEPLHSYHKNVSAECSNAIQFTIEAFENFELWSMQSEILLSKILNSS